MATVTIDWDLPTTAEIIAEICPGVEEAYQWAVYQCLYTLAADVDARLKRGHLRDCQGRVITRFDEWLRAAEAGEWSNGN
jgi:hypothetical protein